MSFQVIFAPNSSMHLFRQKLMVYMDSLSLGLGLWSFHKKTTTVATLDVRQHLHQIFSKTSKKPTSVITHGGWAWPQPSSCVGMRIGMHSAWSGKLSELFLNGSCPLYFYKFSVRLLTYWISLASDHKAFGLAKLNFGVRGCCRDHSMYFSQWRAGKCIGTERRFILSGPQIKVSAHTPSEFTDICVTVTIVHLHDFIAQCRWQRAGQERKDIVRRSYI